MKGIARRTFLTNGIGLIGVSAVVGISVRYHKLDVADVVESIVRHYLGEDRLQAGASRAFALDYAQVTGSSVSVRSSMALGVYFSPTFRKTLSVGNLKIVEKYDRKVITDFLLSSSFEAFSESEAPLSYQGLNLDRACNPFVRYIHEG